MLFTIYILNYPLVMEYKLKIILILIVNVIIRFNVHYKLYIFSQCLVG